MSDTPVLLSIDQGTTSSRAVLFSSGGDVLAVRQKELTLHTPHNGWVEQNPDDILQDTLWCICALAREEPDLFARVVGAGITNQRETTILWDKRTGKPIYNAIVWQDRRTADVCCSLKEGGHESMITAKTGLILDPYFSATKIAWILDHVTGARDAAHNGHLAFGTVDSFLLWHLTGGRVHATDITNASRTMLYNITRQTWDENLLALFDIPSSLLPAVHDNVHAYGVMDVSVCGRPLVIGGMAGDQQAALIGQACFSHGMVKSTYGTGCFALMNIGDHFVQSRNRLLTTVAYRVNGAICYALEGSIFVAGAAVQWLRDGVGMIDRAGDTEAIACSIPDTDGVYFIPAFTGMGAPFWRPEIRGAIFGLTRGTMRSHMVRAALEAQAYQTRDLMAAFEADAGAAVHTLRVDGGLVANNFVCQFLSDQLGVEVDRPRVFESTAWGAACLAGLQAGIFHSFEDIRARWAQERSFSPQMGKAQADTLYAGWQNAVTHLCGK